MEQPPSNRSKKRWLSGVIVGVSAGLVLAGLGTAGGLLAGAARKKSGTTLSPAAGVSQDLMRISFRPGAPVTYKVTMSISGMTSGLGPAGPGGSNTAPIDISMTGNLQIQMIDRTDDGSTRVRIGYANLKLAGTVAGQNLGSESPAELNGAQPVTMTIAPNGAYSTEPGVVAGTPAVSSFGLWSPLPMLPDRHVEEGETWSRRLEVPLAPAGSIEVTIDTESIMVGWEETELGKSARMRTSYMTSLSGVDLGQAGGSDLTVRGSHKATVTYLFSAARNELVSAEIDLSTINLEMTSASTGQTYRTDLTLRGQIERVG